jgi:hypothetical protein
MKRPPAVPNVARRADAVDDRGWRAPPGVPGRCRAIAAHVMLQGMSHGAERHPVSHRWTRSVTAETRAPARGTGTLRTASPLRERTAGQSALLPIDAAARRPEWNGPPGVSPPQTPLESAPRCEEHVNRRADARLSRRVHAAPARDSLAPFGTLGASEGWEGQLEIAVLPQANDALQRRTNRHRHGNTSVVFAGELDGTGVALVKARESWRI